MAEILVAGSTTIAEDAHWQAVQSGSTKAVVEGVDKVP